jgi:phenylacetate-CoA ligase
MSKVTGRRDDMLVLRGVNVYPSEIERVLLAEPSLCPDYLLVRDERSDMHQLIACCEYLTAHPDSAGHAAAGGQAGPPRAGVPGEPELEARLRAVLGVGVRVKVLPAGTVPRSEVGKAVRVVRWRDGEPPLPGLG